MSPKGLIFPDPAIYPNAPVTVEILRGANLFFEFELVGKNLPQHGVLGPGTVGEVEVIQKHIEPIGASWAAGPFLVEGIIRLLCIGHLLGEDVLGKFDAASADPFHFHIVFGFAGEECFHLHIGGKRGGHYG